MADSGFIVMADITGYTVYLNESELDHAQESLVAILDVIVGSTDAPPGAVSGGGRRCDLLCV
jgi:hypothetical protein